MGIDKVLTNIKDYHLPIVLLMFFTGVILQWFGKMDYAFVAFTGTVMGGVGVHAFSPAARQPDVVQPPVDVSVRM